MSAPPPPPKTKPKPKLQRALTVPSPEKPNDSNERLPDGTAINPSTKKKYGNLMQELQGKKPAVVDMPFTKEENVENAVPKLEKEVEGLRKSLRQAESSLQAKQLENMELENDIALLKQGKTDAKSDHGRKVSEIWEENLRMKMSKDMADLQRMSAEDAREFVEKQLSQQTVTRKELNMLRRKINSLEDANHTLQQHQVEIASELAEKDKAVVQMMEEKETLRAESLSYKREMEEKEKSLEEVRLQKAEKEKELQDLHFHMENQLSHQESSYKELNILKEKIISLEDTNHQLQLEQRGKIFELQKKDTALKEIKLKQDEKDKDMQDLQLMMAQDKKKLKEILQEKELLSSESMQYKRELAQQKLEYQTLDQETKAKGEAIEFYESEMSQQETSIEKLRSENRIKEEEIEKFKAKYEQEKNLSKDVQAALGANMKEREQKINQMIQDVKKKNTKGSILYNI